ncbi:MAG TPA: helix-turn-helix domain-containing protein [Mycobacteriales bacterium]|nr:helix-turn-helix domain-containing protein [Mycobacteriales bacterium]
MALSDDPVVAEYRRCRPAPALRPYVADYSGWRQRGGPPARHRGLPSPYLTFIVTFDEPLVIAAHPDPRQPASTHRTLLGGLHTAPALITHGGRQAGVQVSLHALGARALLGLPAGELAQRDLDADDVLGPLATELYERVGAAATWPDRFAAVDAVLLRRLDPRQQVAAEVRHAWGLLLARGGRVRADELAAATGWSGRHLAARFAVEVGLAPKAAARVARFDRARRLLQGDPDRCLADLAGAAGFYDQAHLAREFRALAGCPPSTWVAEELRQG